MNKYSALLLIVALSMMAKISHAEALRLPGLFADHMVLQRDARVRFWGWSKPDAAVTVEINGARAEARANAQGAWELFYPARPAGGPYEVVVRTGGSGNSEIRLKDVYFGDVWLASGQSNMEWKIGWKIANMDNEIKDSEYPLIRFFEVPNEISPSPQPDIAPGAARPQWRIANPKTVADFSAVAWFFAKRNHKEKNVAVGIIDSTWGGTPAETWVDAKSLLDLDDYKAEARNALDQSHDWNAAIAANRANEELKWKLIADKQAILNLKAHQADYNDSNWKTVTLPNRQPLFNFVWLRKSFELSGNINTPARLRLGDLVQEALIFVNGKLIAEETWQQQDSVYDLPAGTLKKGRNVIALRIANSWNNEVYAGKAGEMQLQLLAGVDRKIDLSGDWRYNNTLEPEMPLVLRYNWTPGFIYNAMIHPIQGFSMRGVIWYQGESNTDRPQAYASLFKTLITDWRSKWKQGDFPFLFVQLAGYDDRNPIANWPLLREAQAKALELPATGMAVTLDIGDPEDIHPRNKQDVGARLWLNARKIAFGEDVLHSGPIYKKHRISGNRVIIDFDHAGAGLMPTKDHGFIIAGSDRRFYPAQAVVEGNSVIVSSPDVPKPAAVRYGWDDYLKVDLYNRAGLPAAPFRTDH